MDDARRKQVQHERLVADLYGVTSVMSALVPDDDIETFGEQINNLSFAFVSPLGTDDNNDFGHELGRWSLDFGL